MARHVSDIIAGRSADGSTRHGAWCQVLAVKVCISVSTACNGIALLKAMDFALDPNGDGDMADAVESSTFARFGLWQIEDDYCRSPPRTPSSWV